MKNYIDFTVDAASDNTLGDDLHKVVAGGNPQEVSNWMESRGYEVSVEDSQKLVDNSSDFKTTKLGFFY